MLEKCGRLNLTVFHLIWVMSTYGNWRNQNPGGSFGGTSYLLRQHCQFSPFLKWNWLNKQCFLAGSSKTATRILIFFNCHGCQTFILADIHCYLSALKIYYNIFFLSGVKIVRTEKTVLPKALSRELLTCASVYFRSTVCQKAIGTELKMSKLEVHGFSLPTTLYLKNLLEICSEYLLFHYF